LTGLEFRITKDVQLSKTRAARLYENYTFLTFKSRIREINADAGPKCELLEGFLRSVETNGRGRLVSFPRGGSIKQTTHGNALGILTFSLPKTSARVLPLLQSATEGETTLADLSGILKQLKKERDRVQQQLSGLNAALEAFAAVYRNNGGASLRRTISAKGRARIAAAQKARWAKVKEIKIVHPKPGKRVMSASARRKIAAAQRARWAKVRQTQGKKAA
jgi:hypothetical protein